MKKKLFMLLSLATLAMVGFNTTACSDDDDDDNKQEIKDAAEQGKADGEAFAATYNSIKEKGVLSSATNIKNLYSSIKKYKASEDKAYKGAFISAATGATGLAEEEVDKIMGNDSVNAVTDFLKELFGEGANSGASTDTPSEN